MNTKNKNLITYLIILFGILIRVLFLTKIPAGLNCDEASMAYEAFSILNTGHDRNGIFYPVYLLAWGSGQSALMTYLTIPFVKFFGLTVFSIRLAQAIISSLSIFAFKKIIDIIYEDDDSAEGVFIIKSFSLLFFVLNPYHIMKSRWTVDANILPDFMLFAVCFLILAIKKKKTRYPVLSSILFSLSTYTYLTAIIGVAAFLLLFLLYNYRNRVFKVKKILLQLFIIGIICIPIILFVIVNIFNLRELKFFLFTIPKLRVNRMINESIASSGINIASIFINLFNTFKLIIIQNDGLYWNSVKGFGMYYIFSFPIFIIGIVNYIKNKLNKALNNNIADDIFMIWLLSGIFMSLFLKEANINRINYFIIPIIYFVTRGFAFLFKAKSLRMVSFVVLIVSFSMFSYKYVALNLKKLNGDLIMGENTSERDIFTSDMEELVKYLEGTNFSKVNVNIKVPESHIYFLFYSSFNSDTYVKTETLYNKKNAFDNVKSFGRYNFLKTNYVEFDDNSCFVCDKKYLNNFMGSNYDIAEIGRFIVVSPKKQY